MTLSCYTEPCFVGDIEFFESEKTSVIVVSSESPQLEEILSRYFGLEPVSLDLEWVSDSEAIPGTLKEIEIIQFCSQMATVVITCDSFIPPPCLIDFFLTHSFFGTGMVNDRTRLFNFISPHLGERMSKDEFSAHLDSMVDIQTKWMIPTNNSISFDSIVKCFSDKKTLFSKDRKVSCSNWADRPLSDLQISYAAYDAVAIFHVHKHLSAHPPATRQYFSHPALRFIDLKHKFPLKTTGRAQSDGQKVLPLSPLPPFFDREIQSQIINDDMVLEQLKLAFQAMCEQEGDLEYLWNHFSDDTRKLYVDSRFVMNMKLLALSYDLLRAKKMRILPCNVFSLIKESNSQRTLLDTAEIYYERFPFEPVSPTQKEMLLIIMELCNFIVAPLPFINPQFAPQKYTTQGFSSCNICEKRFDNNEDLSDHCWEKHSIFLFQTMDPGCIFVHTEAKSLEEANKCFNLSITLEEGHKCTQCGVVLHSEREVASHWATQHSQMQLVDADVHSRWPLKACYFTAELNHPRFKVYKPERAILLGKLLTKKANYCTQCNTKFFEPHQIARHSFEYHTILVPCTHPWYAAKEE